MKTLAQILDADPKPSVAPTSVYVEFLVALRRLRGVGTGSEGQA